eukprot:1540764-Pleurochrysis_carterae.AAC.1
MESRRVRWPCGRSAAIRRSSTMSAVDSSPHGESTAEMAGYFGYVKRRRRRSTKDAPAWSE